MESKEATAKRDSFPASNESIRTQVIISAHRKMQELQNRLEKIENELKNNS